MIKRVDDLQGLVERAQARKGPPKLIRYRAHVVLEIDVEVGANGRTEAVDRLEELLDVLADKIPTVLYRRKPPKHIAGTPTAVVIDKTASEPERI